MICETTLLPTNGNLTKVDIDMSAYPNILTPPSNDGSPRSIYLMSSSPHFISSPESSDNSMTCMDAKVYIDMPSTQITNFQQHNALGPSLHIIEEPVDRFRFRYKSEMTGTHGSLNGVNNDKSRKITYPTVELRNYQGDAIIRCSIYQINAKDKDNMPHAHRLVKKSGKDEIDDPHEINVSPTDGYQAIFHNMGIIHTAKKNIQPELYRKKTKLKKEEIARLEGRIRDLTTHEIVEIKRLAENECKSINLNVVCLRFDAFLCQNGILLPLCQPVYTHGINNLKSALTGELKIVRMDHCSSQAKGGLEVFILVERVTKKNIRIRFFEIDEYDNEIWEDYGKFSDLDVHHQYAIVFKTPPYKNPDISEKVKVFIELVRPSDNSRSDPKEFTYIPTHGKYKPGSKRSRPDFSSSETSGSYSSSELPAPLQDLSLNAKIDSQFSSEELYNAIHNVDSDDFKRIFDENVMEYLENSDSSPIMVQAESGYALTIDAGVPLENRRNSPKEDQANAKKILNDLQQCLKTRPTEERLIHILKQYFERPNYTNPLHVFVRYSYVEDYKLVCTLFSYYGLVSLLNVKDSNGETCLHIACSVNNNATVRALLKFKADVTITNNLGNTPLHSAALSNASIDVFEALFSSKSIKEIIDSENDEGNTALNIAIDKQNLIILKLLYGRGANINKVHKKAGFTPLRFAIEKQNVKIVQFLLSLDSVDVSHTDFSEVNSIQAGLQSDSPAITEVIKKYVKENNLHPVIKEEMDDDFSEGEGDLEINEDIKEEVPDEDELKQIYSKVDKFPRDSLEKVAKIVDDSGHWLDLAELLELEHLLKSDLFVGAASPSKQLLNYSIDVNGDSLLQIRNFLENLDIVEAVRLMDEKVRATQT